MVKNLDDKGEHYKTIKIGGKKVKVPILFVLPEELGEKEVEIYRHPEVKIDKAAESKEKPLDELTHGKLEEIEKDPSDKEKMPKEESEAVLREAEGDTETGVKDTIVADPPKSKQISRDVAELEKTARNIEALKMDVRIDRLKDAVRPVEGQGEMKQQSGRDSEGKTKPDYYSQKPNYRGGKFRRFEPQDRQSQANETRDRVIHRRTAPEYGSYRMDPEVVEARGAGEDKDDYLDMTIDQHEPILHHSAGSPTFRDTTDFSNDEKAQEVLYGKVPKTGKSPEGVQERVDEDELEFMMEKPERIAEENLDARPPDLTLEQLVDQGIDPKEWYKTDRERKEERTKLPKTGRSPRTKPKKVSQAEHKKILDDKSRKRYEDKFGKDKKQQDLGTESTDRFKKTKKSWESWLMKRSTRKYWLYGDGKTSKESEWHNQIHEDDMGEMEKGSAKITHEVWGGDNHFHVDLRGHLTDGQKKHISQQIKENDYHPDRTHFNHGHNNSDTYSSTKKIFGDAEHTLDLEENTTHTANLGKSWESWLEKQDPTTGITSENAKQTGDDIKQYKEIKDDTKRYSSSIQNMYKSWESWLETRKDSLDGKQGNKPSEGRSTHTYTGIREQTSQGQATDARIGGMSQAKRQERDTHPVLGDITDRETAHHKHGLKDKPTPKHMEEPKGRNNISRAPRPQGIGQTNVRNRREQKQREHAIELEERARRGIPYGKALKSWESWLEKKEKQEDELKHNTDQMMREVTGQEPKQEGIREEAMVEPSLEEDWTDNDPNRKIPRSRVIGSGEKGTGSSSGTSYSEMSEHEMDKHGLVSQNDEKGVENLSRRDLAEIGRPNITQENARKWKSWLAARKGLDKEADQEEQQELGIAEPRKRNSTGKQILDSLLDSNEDPFNVNRAPKVKKP
tara:strand:+ start:5412 stop:8129 length:2718 start_codon:yes stop_codon:yes gene_type:complete